MQVVNFGVQLCVADTEVTRCTSAVLPWGLAAADVLPLSGCFFPYRMQIRWLRKRLWGRRGGSLQLRLHGCRWQVSCVGVTACQPVVRCGRIHRVCSSARALFTDSGLAAGTRLISSLYRNTEPCHFTCHGNHPNCPPSTSKIHHEEHIMEL